MQGLHERLLRVVGEQAHPCDQRDHHHPPIGCIDAHIETFVANAVQHGYVCGSQHWYVCAWIDHVQQTSGLCAALCALQVPDGGIWTSQCGAKPNHVHRSPCTSITTIHKTYCTASWVEKLVWYSIYDAANYEYKLLSGQLCNVVHGA